jgi:hypothetical protein
MHRVQRLTFQRGHQEELEFLAGKESEAKAAIASARQLSYSQI